MESKTKHRILGLLVVIGIIIIALPFFQGRKEIASAPSLVQAPPFPDQAVQVSAESSVAGAPPANQPLIPIQNASSDNGVNQQPDDTIRSDSPSMMPQPAAIPSPTEQQTPKEGNITTPPTDKKDKITELEDKHSDENHNQIKPQEVADSIPTPDIINENVKNNPIAHAKLKKPIIKKSVYKTPFARSVQPVQTTLAQPLPTDHNGLYRLKNAAWVIQIGSFKNKTNALRLVNQLRANGYKAFIQQVSTERGDGTRVFVGPENKQMIARALANRLETHMHLKGVVISYKPLAL